MLVCKEATRLVSEAMDRKLTMGEQLSLKFHLTICSGCRNFNKHMQFLRSAARRLVDRDDGPDQP
ncbi:zf-HC2 domain-containing protein [Chitinivorax sp. B]|uniref:zf-HC2 domain-containing protein n=1 Tax=Chitinivorax sp. B TaxID=2502235 RepID=UPI0010F526D5|nr:zf-HC2 domain-containing protein [Chitinivorax sp. B]